MTAEEKIQAVEDVLDGRIAEARAAFVDRFEDMFFAFLTGSGTTGSVYRRCHHFLKELDRLVGVAKCEAVYAEEWEKWNVKTQTAQPEEWEVYTHGTQEEYAEFPTYQEPEALEEWREDRQHMTRREAYARAFYGGKAA
jgi:hypothetical protein